MSKRARNRSMRGQEEYAVADPYAWVGLDGGLGSAGAMAAAAAGGSSGAGALHAAANDSAFEAADESEPGSEDLNSSSDEEEQTKPARKKAARGSGAAPKAAPKPRKQAKAKAKAQTKEKAVPRIGTNKAKKLYMLDDADLAKMKDVKTKGSMWGINTMYSPAELEEYAHTKHAGSAAFEKHLKYHKGEEESRKERNRGYRAGRAAAALEAVTQYAVPNKAIEVEQYGETKLPDSVLANVMVCLAKTREPGGLRGFACVAKDLANASLANWDLYRAANTGFAALADDARAVPDTPYWLPRRTSWTVWYAYGGHLRHLPGSLGWEFWAGFLRDPLKPTVAQLKQAYEMVGMTPRGTKAELAARLLEVFGLKAATSVPAQLLRVVRVERHRSVRALAWDGPDAAAAAAHDRINTALDQFIQADAATWGHLKRAERDASRPGIASIRATIRQHFSTIDEFVEAAAAADQERVRKEGEAAAAAGGVKPPAVAAANAAVKTMSKYAVEALLSEHWEVDAYVDEDSDGF